MVRLALLIMSLLGMFLLNACGGSNNSSNIDTRDAVFLQKGEFSGKLERVPVAEYDAKAGRVVKKEQPAIFDTENSNVEVDWTTRRVTVVTQLAEDAGKENSEIVLEGTFNEVDGIAYLFPKEGNERGKTADAIAGVRCKDNKCERLTIDMGIRVAGADGTRVLRQEQMDVVNPAPLKVDDITEVEPESSGLNPRTSAPSAPASNETVKPDQAAPVVTPSAPANPPAKPKTAAERRAEEKRLKEEREAQEREEKEFEEFNEPEGEVDALPSVLRIQTAPGDTINNYSESTLFPFNLGEKYLGKAQGGYTNGSLNKATAVTVNVATQTMILSKVLGFFSVSLDDKKYYGSGLLVKTIEEAGKLYTKIFPEQYFEVNDMSKSSGGKIRPHQSHQNGLDVDVRLPRKNTRAYDSAKSWAIIKSFVSLGNVNSIFLNPVRIRELCTYLKSSTEKDYAATFGKLYPESGHTSHMHVRLECTNHNVGCIPKRLTPSKYATCR